MKLEWQHWNTGGKLIFATFFIAIVSMFANWVNILGEVYQSGAAIGAYWLLLLWIYPAYILFSNKPMSRPWGVLCGIASVILSAAYIASDTVVFAGQAVSFASTGAYIFLIVSILLVVAVLKYECYRPIERTAADSVESKPSMDE